MEDFRQTLIKGYELLVRCPLLVLNGGILSVFQHLFIFIMAKFRLEFRLVFLLALVAEVLVIYPFLMGCVIGSFAQLFQTTSITFKEFMANGKRYYNTLFRFELSVVLLIFIYTVLILVSFGAIAFVMFLLSSLADVSMAGFVERLIHVVKPWSPVIIMILIVIVFPLTMGPFVIVRFGREPSKAIEEIYRFARRNLLQIFPFVVIFGLVPVMLDEGVFHLYSGTTPIYVGLAGLLIMSVFKLFYVPTMTVYLSKQLDWFGHPPIGEVPK